MTFSIVARCAETGMFGVAVSSSSPAVAARCAYAQAGVGAVASQNVTDPADPSAKKFGTVPGVAAGMTASGDVVKEPGADDLFIMYGHDFGTPFNFIAATTVVIPSGTQVSGMVDVTISGKIAAKL